MTVNTPLTLNLVSFADDVQKALPDAVSKKLSITQASEYIPKVPSTFDVEMPWFFTSKFLGYDDAESNITSLLAVQAAKDLGAVFEGSSSSPVSDAFSAALTGFTESTKGTSIKAQDLNFIHVRIGNFTAKELDVKNAPEDMISNSHLSDHDLDSADGKHVILKFRVQVVAAM